MNPVDIRLYAIADPARSAGRPLPGLVQKAAENGATLIQYRDKNSQTRELVEQARLIKQALGATGVPLIINDRVDVALASGADGVHLGQQDMAIPDAREILGPDAIVGLSIKTIEEAENADVELLDYAFVGGVFETMSKDNPANIGVAGWKERAAILGRAEPELPIGAIAGIDDTNLQQLLEAGCDGVAVISAIFMARDVGEATRRLRLIMDQHFGEKG